MKVAIDVIGPNPHRDLNVFPILKEKTDKLKTSIKQTGFWDNVMVRPKGNAINGTVFTSQKDLDEFLKENYDNKVVDFPCELCYGHHRLYTIYDINKDPAYESIEIIDIPVKYHDENQMLQIMVHENRSDWSHDISVMVESIGRVYSTLQEQLAEFGPDEFEAYREKYGDNALSDSKAFKEAKGTHGVGYNAIKSYLGGDFSEPDIRGPLQAIKVAKEKGLFELPDCYTVNSSSGLLSAVRLVDKIHDLKVPPYFKDAWTSEVFKMFTVPDQIPTVKSLKGAIGKASASIPMNPITFMKKGVSEKIEPVDLIADLLWEKEKHTIDDALTIDGLTSEEEDWSGHIEVAVERVAAKKRRSDARKAGQEPELEPASTEMPPPSPDDESNLGALDVGNIVGSEGLSTPDGVPVIQDIAPITGLFSLNAPLLTNCAKQLVGRMSDVNPEEVDFFEKLGEIYLILTTLTLEKHGKDITLKYIEAAEERLENLASKVEPSADGADSPTTAGEEAATEEVATEEAATEEAATEEAATEEAATEKATPADKAKAKGRKGLLSKTGKKK